MPTNKAIAPDDYSMTELAGSSAAQQYGPASSGEEARRRIDEQGRSDMRFQADVQDKLRMMRSGFRQEAEDLRNEQRRRGRRGNGRR